MSTMTEAVKRNLPRYKPLDVFILSVSNFVIPSLVFVSGLRTSKRPKKPYDFILEITKELKKGYSGYYCDIRESWAAQIELIACFYILASYFMDSLSPSTLQSILVYNE